MSKLPISVTLDEEIVSQVKDIALQSDRPVSWLVKEALVSYLADLEDAEEALKRMNDPNQKSVSLEDFKKRMGDA